MNFGPYQGGGLAYTGGGGMQQYIAPGIDQNRLVRKETALGAVREIVPPTTHAGIQLFAPWMDVATDEVIFEYINGLTDGLAPAAAEDSESELAQKDDVTMGQGRASLIDWRLKDHYTASEISRYREFLRIAEEVRDTQTLRLTVGSMLEDWANRLAKDTARRRRKLDNRLEWLIMTAMGTGGIAYNDGKIKFNVSYGRPSDQQAQAPASGSYAGTTHDPIGDWLRVIELMYDRYGITLKKVLCSKKYKMSVFRSDKFSQRSGLIVANGSGGITTADPNYVMDGWGPEAAIQVLSNATGLEFIEYDAVYRTRAQGSTTPVNNRFLPQNRVIAFPDEAQITEFDDTGLGLGRMLTAPHPMGNWNTSFYEWEQDTTDPWGYSIGTGIKAFPIFPHMELTYTQDVTLPS